MSNAARIAEIKSRESAATEGPWELLGGGEYISPIGVVVAPDDGGVNEHDAEFIAHARADVPFLLDALEKAEAEVARLMEIIGEAKVCLAAPRPLYTSHEEHYGDQVHDAKNIVRRATHATKADPK